MDSTTWVDDGCRTQTPNDGTDEASGEPRQKEAKMAGKMAERVLCFEQRVLDELGRFQGVCTDVEHYFPHLTSGANSTYIARDEAEKDTGHKQLIPYVLIVCKNDVFRYRRGKRGGEGRLHALYSVGIGGHIAADDRLLFSGDAVGYEDAMWREVWEEVQVSSRFREHCVGLINDDSNDVGRHHLGVVHLMEVEHREVVKNESSITDYGFMDIAQAKASSQEYETWSNLCLARIEELIAGARDAWREDGWRE
jgi:predicted NUDIX family phosphoesterase